MRVYSKPVSVPRLREAFDYRDEDGALIWKIKSGRAAVGHVAASVNHEGYLRANLDGRFLLVHRAVWALCTGDWPEQDIDHVNGIKTDNRISNLRPCTILQNMQNYPIPSTNTSGFMGVSWTSRTQMWQVFIRDQVGNGVRKNVNLGSFDCKEEAAEAYMERKAKIHLFSPVVRGPINAHA